MQDFLQPVAKITNDVAADLLSKHPDLDVVEDKNGAKVIHVEEAEFLLEEDEYVIVEFEPLEVGSPVPKKRPRN